MDILQQQGSSLCSTVCGRWSFVGNLTWQQLAPNPAQYGSAARGNPDDTMGGGSTVSLDMYLDSPMLGAKRILWLSCG